MAPMNWPRGLALKFLLGSALAMLALIVLLAVLLLRGIDIDQINLANFQLEKLHLQLDGKLQLDVGGAQILSAGGDGEDTSKPGDLFDPAVFKQALTGMKYLKKLFGSVDIRNITVDDVTAQFRYREDGAGKLALQGPGADVLILLDSDSENLLLDIEHLRLDEQGLELSGDVNIDTAAVLLEAQLDVLLADTLALDIRLQADEEQLGFEGASGAPITDIEPVVRLLKLGPTIDPWIIDYLSARQIQLKNFRGTVPYDEPEQLLQSLNAEALIDDARYTFAEGLEPVLAAQTRLVFERGVLRIEPREATFYGQDTGDTYVELDFNDDQTILSLYLRTRAQASGGIITLLQHYGIPFPVQQTRGLTDVDLTLRIDLDTGDVAADGRFSAGETVLGVGGQQLDVAGLDIALEKKTLVFEQLDVALGSLISAGITGEFDLDKGEGDLVIAVDKFHWQNPESQLVLLANTAQPLRLSYHFSDEGDSIDVPPSNWRHRDLSIAVGAFSTPFDPDSLSGSLENVSVAIEPGLGARISGRYQAQLPYARLNIAVDSLETDRLTLTQAANTDIALEVGSKITAASTAPIHLSLDGTAIKVQPTRLQYGNNELLIQKSGFEIAQGTTAGLQGRINFATGKGALQLHELVLRDKAGTTIFDAERSISLSIARKVGRLTIGIPQLGAIFSRSGNGSWSADIDDFSRLYTLSPLMQQLQITRGELHVSSATGGTPYEIRGQLRFPLGLLMGPDHRRIQDYRFSGSYEEGQGHLTINRKVQLKWGDKIDIETVDVGFSVAAMTDIFDALNSPGAAGKAPPAIKKRRATAPGNEMTVDLYARNSFIALDDIRRTPVDEFFASYKNGRASAKFYYGAGISALDYADGRVSFAGKGLDISVLTNFVTLADFEGGTVEFRADGDLDELRAAVRIQNTIIKDYKTLNNMLAFINTLPGLLTFNPPDYHRRGLPAREAYLEAVYRHGVVDLKSMVIDSSELDIRGIGIMDLNKNTTDMTFNLISGLRKSVGRIPVIGFLLVGDEKQPTITLKVSGDLQNPTVSNSAAQDLVNYPWQLIQNTISLPGHISTQLQSGPQANKKAP